MIAKQSGRNMKHVLLYALFFLVCSYLYVYDKHTSIKQKKLDALGLSHLKRAPGQKPDIDVFKLVLKEDEDTLPNTGPAQSASK